MKFDKRGNLLLADNHDVGPGEAGNLSITLVMSLIITESLETGISTRHTGGGAMCFRSLMCQDVRDDTRRTML